jgi:hypothetical protein
VSCQVGVDLVDLEAQNAAEANGLELAAIDEPVDRADGAVEQPRCASRRPELWRPLPDRYFLFMPHRDIVSGGRGAVGTPDQSRQAQERLDRFALEWLVDQFPDRPFPGVGPLDRKGLREAAELVLGDAQTALASLAADLDEAPLEPRLASSLSRSRYWVLLALLEVLPSQKHAKQEQLRITGGAPLALCTGDACRIGSRRKRTLHTPYVAGEVRFSVYGCNRIFPTRPRWSARCGRPSAPTATTLAANRPVTRSAPSSGRSTRWSGVRRST